MSHLPAPSSFSERMAAPTSCSLAHLCRLMDSISASAEGSSLVSGGSSLQQSLSNILGLRIPLDAGVEGAAGDLATRLGLKQKSSLDQIAVFAVAKGAILECAKVIGVGGGRAQLDLAGFQFAQLQNQVKEINRKQSVN